MTYSLRRDTPRAWWRTVLVALAMVMLVPVTMIATASVAHADEDGDYSLYKAASNAGNYFNIKNAPNQPGMVIDWQNIVQNPATGGDFLGYGDPQLGPNIIKWMFASLSGSSQTVSYETIRLAGNNPGQLQTDFKGLLDYAHFGAANANLGLDHTIQGPDIITRILNTIGGAIMWVLYGLAIAVSMMFLIVITVLKYLNPFLWFGPAIRELSANFASGMMQGGFIPTEMTGIVDFIKKWYHTLYTMAWGVLIPLFLGFLIGGLLLFKRMNRGSALKKFFIRVLFLGVGLPIIGTMYSGILVQFDDLSSTTAGPTRVVISNYVDFESWMVNDRLAIPNDAVIAWDKGRASTEALMKVRDTALAINKQSYGGSAGAFKDVTVTGGTRGSSAWENNRSNVSMGLTSSDSLNNEDNANRTPTQTEKSSVIAVFNLLGKAISSKTVTPSDFESGIKGTITSLTNVGDEDKKGWFKGRYNDPDSYGEKGVHGGFGSRDIEPDHNPVVAVAGSDHLTSSNPGSDTTRFTTPNPSVSAGCVYTVADGSGPARCNLSPLAAYNYLNTKFSPDSVTMFSSKNITSNFIRSDHLSVSQVGTGIGQFSYWMQAATTLACLVVLGFWYALGMLMGSVKRILSLITAIPFATLGVLSSIAKVITYTIALILEVLITMFMYFFVSELLISVPTTMANAINGWVAGTRG